MKRLLLNQPSTSSGGIASKIFPVDASYISGVLDETRQLFR